MDREHHGDGEGEEPRRYRYDAEASQRMIEEAFSNEELSEMQLAIARRVLGDCQLFCESCGGFCHHQTVKVRDLFIQRGYELVSELLGFFDLYLRERKMGIEEPFQLIAKIYQRWSEIGFVYDMAEPQERVQASVDPLAIGPPFSSEGPFIEEEEEGDDEAR